MITMSTSALARRALALTIRNLEVDIEEAQFMKLRTAKPGKMKDQNEYFHYWHNREMTCKDRRRRIERAIRELKDWTWNGDPASLPHNE